MRWAILLLGTTGCTATALEDFRSTLALVVVDTDGVKMGRGRDVWDDAWVDAGIGVYEIGAGGVTSVLEGADYDGPGAIHVRGNSSRDYDKVGYRVELRDGRGDDRDAALLGMPSEADWVLHGPYSDKSLVRNHLMYALSNDIGRYAARTRFVELFVVDDQRAPSTRHYRGIYVLAERIERDAERVDLARMDASDVAEPEVSGGYLLRRDWIEDDEKVLRTPIYSDRLLVEDPEPLEPAQRDWLEAWFGSFEASLQAPNPDPRIGYPAYADVDSFVDHYLLVELGRNVDGYVLSTWMSKDRDGKLTMGPIWDYNGALGNADYFDAWETEGWHWQNPSFPADNRNGFHWYEQMLADPGFRDRIAERWRVHRAGPLADEAILARIDAARDALAEAAPRNFDRWPVLGKYVWPNDDGCEDRETWDEEVDYLRAWVTARAAWIDVAVDDIPG